MRIARGIEIARDTQNAFLQPHFHGVEDDSPICGESFGLRFLWAACSPSARSVPDLFDSQPYRSGSRIYDAPSQ